MNQRDARICAIFDELDEEYPDKSTPWLFAMTIDGYRLLYEKEIDDGDIATALYAQSLERENTDDQKT